MAAAAISVLVAVAGFVTFPPIRASAGQAGALDDGKELLAQASITVEQAIASAQSASTGAIGEVDLEHWRGKLVFNIDVGNADVKVDAATGAVLSTDSGD